MFQFIWLSIFTHCDALREHIDGRFRHVVGQNVCKLK